VVELLPCPDVQITLMERGILHCLDCTNLNCLDHGRYGSAERFSKCWHTVWAYLHNTEPKHDNQTKLDMELDLQMPKHNRGIECKCSIQGCTKTSLEVCIVYIPFLAITLSHNTWVPDLAYRVALCPEQRYEKKADDTVAGSAEVKNAFSVLFGPL
jgi:hypothetical protein